MTSLALSALAIFLLAQAEGTQRAGLGFAEEVIDKNGFSHGRSFDPQANLPSTFRRNSRSMSFVDYFFPASRQAKVSENFKSQRQLAEIASTQSQNTEYAPETTLITTKSIVEKLEATTLAADDLFSVTIEEGRATGSSKKGTTASGKRKSTSRVTTASPKTKASQKVSSQSTHGSSISHSTKATQKVTTTKPVTKQDTTYANTKTTHKHYTIHPSVESTNSAANPPSSYKTKQPDRTTTKISSSASSQTQTTLGQKVTLAELAKVTEDVHPESPSGSEVGTTEVNAREGELDLREKPIKHQVEINSANKNESVPLPDGSTSVLAKPTKYHYYPHNQHIYLLPECAIQQVCNAVYVRLNYTQPLCACPSRHRDPCSASLNADDLHTTQLSTDSKKKYAAKAITLVKTCEATSEMRECRSPRDWSLLALQNIRTGKSHYLVICRCPEECVLEGPMSHDQPTYASVPGIRVYGMMCVQPQQNQYTSQSQGYNSVTSRPATSSYKVGYSQPGYNQNQEPNIRYPEYANPGVYYNRMARKVRETERVESPPFPWEKARELALTADWEN